MESAGFINIASVDSHEAMVAPSWSLGWQLALEGYKPKRGQGLRADYDDSAVRT